MKRMCVLCVALFVLVMAIPAWATQTRVMTMGNQPMFIQDDYNIWHFTSTVNNYPRHLIVDHNGAYMSSPFYGDTRVGMLVPVMKSGVVGAFVSDGWVEIPLTPMDAQQRIDLFYGYRAATFDLGLHVDWWGDKEEETGTQSTTAMGLQAGVGFNANGNMFELDAFYRSIDWTWEPLTGGAPVNEKDAGSWIGAAARYIHAYNNMVTLVPAISVSQFKVSESTTGTGDGDELKETHVDLGLGCNTVPLQGTEFVTSVGVMIDKEKASDTAGTYFEESTNTVPYIKFGADIQVKPWLNFRVGAHKYVLSTVEDKSPPLPDEKSTHSDLEYRIGAGIMLGDVQFDVDVNKRWLNSGPYLLSGEDAGDMFTYISFKYDFR